MNNIKKIMVAALASTLLLAGACSKPPVTSVDDNPVDNSVITLANFDTWQSGFQLMRLMSGFGDVSVSDDAAYAVSGSSAMIRPLGGHSKQSLPTMYIPFKSTVLDYDYCDVSKLEKITFTMFNSEDVDVNLTYGLVCSIINVDTIEKGVAVKTVLKPGRNDIEYYVDLNVINISYDITAIEGIYYIFDNNPSRELSDAPVIYLDDIKMHYYESAPALEDIVTLGTNEICDFEKLYQKYIITADSPNAKCLPEYSIVGQDNGVMPTSGQKMLKVVTHGGDATQASWPRIIIAQKIMQKCALKTIPEDKFAQAYVAFDVYNTGNDNFSFYPEYYKIGGTNWQATSVIAAGKKWTTYKFPVSSIKKENIIDPGSFKIAWGEYIGEDITFYFDNFRIITDY